MRIKIAKTIVPYKLSRELIEAGVLLSGKVANLPKGGLYIPLEDETQKNELLPTIEAVIEAHDGIDDIRVLKDDAITQIKNLPGWATWTYQDGLDWYNTEIVPLSIPNSIKAFIRASIIMHIATRDNLWPELSE